MGSSRYIYGSAVDSSGIAATWNGGWFFRAEIGGIEATGIYWMSPHAVL
jgi:transposase